MGWPSGLTLASPGQGLRLQPPGPLSSGKPRAVPPQCPYAHSSPRILHGPAQVTSSPCSWAVPELTLLAPLTSPRPTPHMCRSEHTQPASGFSLPFPAQLLAQPGDLSFNPVPYEKGAEGKRRHRGSDGSGKGLRTVGLSSGIPRFLGPGSCAETPSLPTGWERAIMKVKGFLAFTFVYSQVDLTGQAWLDSSEPWISGRSGS